LAEEEVAQKSLLRQRNGKLLRPEEAEQEIGICNTITDRVKIPITSSCPENALK